MPSEASGQMSVPRPVLCPPLCPPLCPLDAWIARRCGLADERPDPKGVKVWQLKALQENLRRVEANSRFYQEAFARLPAPVLAGIRQGRWPRTVESMSADMVALPLTPSSALEDTEASGGQPRYQFFLCGSQDDVARVVTLRTSGTTGHGKRLAFSSQDLALTVEFFSIGMQIMVRPGEVALILLPGGDTPYGVADMLRRGLLRHPAAAQGVPGDPAATPESFAEELDRLRPACVVAAPSQLRRLVASPQVNALASSCVRTVLSSSEPLPAELNQSVSTAWACEIFEHYGLTEAGYGGGVECAAHDGYHLREADIWLEIVDPLSGLPVPDGEPGEIVLTTLTRRAMPLVRYRTGDVAAMLPGPCACGSPMRRLGPFLGRFLAEEAGGGYILSSPAKGRLNTPEFPKKGTE